MRALSSIFAVICIPGWKGNGGRLLDMDEAFDLDDWSDLDGPPLEGCRECWWRGERDACLLRSLSLSSSRFFSRSCLSVLSLSFSLSFSRSRSRSLSRSRSRSLSLSRSRSLSLSLSRSSFFCLSRSLANWWLDIEEALLWWGAVGDGSTFIDEIDPALINGANQGAVASEVEEGGNLW